MENKTNETTAETQHNNIHQIMLWAQMPIGTLIVIGNLVTLVALPHATKIQTSLRILFGNMAITDTMVGLIFIFNCIVFYNHNLLTMEACAFRYSVMYVSVAVSMSNVSMMALDRCLTIKFPYKYLTKMTLKKAVISVLVAWVINIIIVIYSMLGPFTNYEVCIFMELARTETLLSPCIMLYLHLLVVIISYIMICGEVRRHATAIHPVPAPRVNISMITNANENIPRCTQPTTQVPPQAQPQAPPQALAPAPRPQGRLSWKYMNATKTVTVILGAFVCFNMPLILIFMFAVINPELRRENTYIVVANSCFFIAVLNSLVNPIIYQLKLKPMRVAVLKVFCKVRCEKRIRDLQHNL